jgi:hypothetical protein
MVASNDYIEMDILVEHVSTCLLGWGFVSIAVDLTTLFKQLIRPLP